STYTWQIPSPCPSTGTLLFSKMYSTNCWLPLGTINSTSRFNVSSSITSARDCSSVTASLGAFGSSANASCQSATSTSFVFAASAPPFSSTAFPDFKASAETCGTTSGRDSNTTATTPNGQLSL